MLGISGNDDFPPAFTFGVPVETVAMFPVAEFTLENAKYLDGIALLHDAANFDTKRSVIEVHCGKVLEQQEASGGQCVYGLFSMSKELGMK